MAKIRLTKNELHKQKDELKRFQRYLPTLMLKKQQLQLEILKIQKKIEECKADIERFKSDLNQWIDVFAEKISIDIKNIIKVEKIRTSTGNIAGVDIPVLEGIEFTEEEYDFITTPLWLDYGIEAIKKEISLKITYQILEKQINAVREELKITTQRVNLFEKVKIPEAKENIKKIQIYLGDMQTAQVVIGKIAKEKIQRKTKELVAV